MIPIADPQLGEAEHDAVERVMNSGQLADGEEVRKFEAEFADFCGTARGVATTNGTTALHAAFEALDIGEGDAVITTPFSFVASANAIRLAGAEPVFADIHPATFTLDPREVEQVVRERDDVAAILPVHLYGLSAEMDHLGDIADDHDLALVEDAAQAHGAEYDRQRVGSFGDAACFSFYPTKNMTTGEGGMVTTDRDDVAERLARFVDHGQTARYEHAEVGHNFRMTSLCAAIGRAQLPKLTDYTIARRGNAAYLSELLKNAGVITPNEPPGTRHVYHQYTIRHDDRDGLREHLAEAGVGTGIHYPTPIHRQPAYAHVEDDYPVAERAAEQVLSLPVHPGLSTDDLRTICDAVESYTTEDSQELAADTGRRKA